MPNVNRICMKAIQILNNVLKNLSKNDNNKKKTFMTKKRQYDYNTDTYRCI